MKRFILPVLLSTFIVAGCNKTTKIIGNMNIDGYLYVQDSSEQYCKAAASSDFFSIKETTFDLKKEGNTYTLQIPLILVQKFEDLQFVNTKTFYVCILDADGNRIKKDNNWEPIIFTYPEHIDGYRIQSLVNGKGRIGSNSTYSFKYTNKNAFDLNKVKSFEVILNILAKQKEEEISTVSVENKDVDTLKEKSTVSVENKDVDTLKEKTTVSSITNSESSNIKNSDEETPKTKNRDSYILKPSFKITGPLAECFEVVDGEYELYKNFMSDEMTIKFRRTNAKLPLKAGENIDKRKFNDGLTIDLCIEFRDKKGRKVGDMCCLDWSSLNKLAESSAGKEMELDFSRLGQDYVSDPVTFEVHTYARRYKNGEYEETLY